jgi:hypothetical protein
MKSQIRLASLVPGCDATRAKENPPETNPAD